MRKLDLDMFTAMNSAGGTNPTYQWVEAVIRLQRPFVVMVAMLTWASFYFSQTPMPDTVANFTGAIGFYLFGDRTLFYAKKMKNT